MIMDAFDEILSKLPSDIGGSTADNGFSFQKNWALKKLLELEDSGESYTIIFDYHDDIEVLDSDEDAANIDFYQIKTSVNYWQANKLCQKETDSKGKVKKSYLGKLIKHYLEFEKTRDVYFVTNTFVSKNHFDSKSDSHDEVLSFSKLSEKVQNDIKSKIEKELGTQINPNCYEHLFIIQNQLNLNDSTDSLVGKVTTFLRKHLGTSEINPRSFYDAIFAEITKRNDYKEVCHTKEDLFTHKAISKSQFESFINELHNYTSFEMKCQSAMRELMDGTTFQQRRIIKQELENKIRNEYFQYDNIEFCKLSNCIRDVNTNIEFEDCNTFWELGNKVLTEVKSKYSNPLGYKDSFILALIFYLTA